MKKIKYFIPSILFMIIIFWFSHQTGTESSGLSTYIVNWLENHLHIIVPELIIRKMAHMGEYALLTFTFIYGFSKNKFILQKVLLFSLSATSPLFSFISLKRKSVIRKNSTLFIS